MDLNAYNIQQCYDSFSQIESQSLCLLLSPNSYKGSPHTSQSFLPRVFSNVQCGHTCPLADPPLSVAPTRVGATISSNSSGGMSSSKRWPGGPSGAGCVGRRGAAIKGGGCVSSDDGEVGYVKTYGRSRVKKWRPSASSRSLIVGRVRLDRRDSAQ